MEIGNGTHLLHDGEHPWLTVIVAVGTNSEVDLIGMGIRLVRSSQLEYTVPLFLVYFRPRKARKTRTHREAREGLPSIALQRDEYVTFLHPLIGGWARSEWGKRTSRDGFGHLRL